MAEKPTRTNCINCRGDRTRESLVRRYDLRAVQQGRILPGHPKTSCTGDVLTDHYYVFECRPKGRQESDSFTLVCGHHAARHFLALTGAAPPPMFDPFLAEQGTHVSSAASGNSKRAATALHPVGQQLLIAAQLTCAIAKDPPQTPLLNVIEGAKHALTAPPPRKLIASLNTIFGLIAPGRTLHDVLRDLQAAGRVRPCRFDLLHQTLVEHYPDRVATSIYREQGGSLAKNDGGQKNAPA